ncbi:putative DNA-binding helix-hairpin-helix protein [Bradyrhizobium sp. USDA 10063]
MKTIPGASDELIAEAGIYADRLSMNVELPSERSLAAFAPEKSSASIKKGLALTRAGIDNAVDARKRFDANTAGRARPPRFAPAGQSTQIIIGADQTDDLAILGASVSLYASYRLKRVYYSGFSPTGHPSAHLPTVPTPLVREHRLYQADWLLRYYGFTLPDLAAAAPSGALDHDIDPKLAWALRHRHCFPVDVNRGEREMLLRVPGLGVRTVDRLIGSRRTATLRLDDVARLCGAISRARPFIVTADWHPGARLEDAHLQHKFAPRAIQLRLFG